MPNRLLREASPYLRQHAENAVDWYPFGEEALARARSADRPIFLSIGYAACHWCHVMAEESFEDAVIADAINSSFVPVKVDREERPDLDRIYQTICLLVTGQGGWPLSCFLTPDLRPFHVGTYFPPQDRFGRPGLPRILEAIRKAWESRRAEIELVADDWAEALRRSQIPRTGGAPLPERPLAPFAAALARRYDQSYAGFGGAPKFPPHQYLQLLLRHFHGAHEAPALEMVVSTLRRMARGGIRDQLGGGFHRYAVDRAWGVPHFEKMLYDNALLAPLYLDAAALIRDPSLQDVGRSILADLEATFSLPEGGFIASVDADSPLGEGAYYTFTQAEIGEAVGPDAQLLCRHFGVDEGPGPVDGRHVLRIALSAAELAAEEAGDEQDLAQRIDSGRAALLAARSRRPEPARDGKVLAGWNGLALSAFARGGLRLRDPALIRRARAAGEFLGAQLLSPDGTLLRRWYRGTAGIGGYLEDYAYLAQGFLDLHQATQEPVWLERAYLLSRRALALFYDEAAGGFRQAAEDTPGLIVRPFEAEDSATPSPQSVLLEVFLRLTPLVADKQLETVASDVLSRHAPELAEGDLAFSSLALAGELLQDGPLELALVPGHVSAREAMAWLSAVGETYQPLLVTKIVQPGDPSPIAAGRSPRSGATVAYICRMRACSQPITTLEGVLDGLRLSL